MTDPEPTRPRWLAARTPRSALIVAIGYTVLFVLFVAIAIAGGSVWNVLLAIVAAVAGAAEWATYAWFLRHRE